MLYLITYDLNAPRQDYQTLFSAIEQISNGYTRCLKSVWLINTNLNADQIVHKLLNYIDENDGLFVAKVTSDFQAQLPNEQCKWIQEAMSNGLI